MVASIDDFSGDDVRFLQFQNNFGFYTVALHVFQASFSSFTQNLKKKIKISRHIESYDTCIKY